MSAGRSAPPVLMAVHAHPDDESSQTGGTLARYAAAGVRTVLITCTDGGDEAANQSGEEWEVSVLSKPAAGCARISD